MEMTYRPTTLGELVEAGYRHRSVQGRDAREPPRDARARARTPSPGILGYERTVVPALVNAVLARHDLILLGLRGQAKTRILRALVNLLDEETPVIVGSELNESPFAPFTKYARSLAATAGPGRPRRVAPPRGALPREARDARRDDRRPHRRRRPGEGGDAQEDVRGRGGDPLRDRPADEPRHLRDQRAPRPRPAHPGRAPEHPRGARPADPRLPGPDPARRRDGLLGEPRGLHEPREHHHAAEGPDRLADPDALPARRRRRRRRSPTRRPGASERSTASRSPPRLLQDARRGGRLRRARGATSSTRPRASRPGCRSRCASSSSRTWSGAPSSTGEKVVAPRLVDLFATLPAITGKVEMVFEGEQQGAEIVARKLIGDAVKALFEATFPPVEGPRARGRARRAGARPTRTRPARSAATREPSPPSSGPTSASSRHFTKERKIVLSDETPVRPAPRRPRRDRRPRRARRVAREARRRLRAGLPDGARPRGARPEPPDRARGPRFDRHLRRDGPAQPHEEPGLGPSAPAASVNRAAGRRAAGPSSRRPPRGRALPGATAPGGEERLVAGP